MVDRAELARLLRLHAENMGINPSDLGTAISYETAGTFDPQIKGPTTQWGQHIGLIQAGEPQRKQFGIDPSAPLADQFKGIEAYLRNAGVKPGMGLMDVYSAINAGRVGRYGASDAHNGGAPGTVADKVASMIAHRQKANALLGIPGAAPAGVAGPMPVAAGPAPAAPASVAAPAGSAPAATPEAAAPFDLAGLTRALQQAQPQDQPMQLAAIDHPEQAFINRAKRRMAQLAAAREA